MKTTIKIAVMNLQSGVATTRGLWHYFFTTWKYWLPHSNWAIRAAGRMLVREGVDIALVTEISEYSLRSGLASQTRILAHYGEMPYRHFFSSQKIGTWIFHEGNAIVSRYPLSGFDSHLLPIELMRMALEEACVEIEGKLVTLFLGHLAIKRRNREAQVEDIIAHVNRREGPRILGGDFNEPDPSAFAPMQKATGLAHMCTAKTFPAWEPKHPFDCAFLSREFTVKEHFAVTKSPFSDHLPLIVRLEL